jgi:hypothetical protein
VPGERAGVERVAIARPANTHVVVRQVQLLQPCPR